MPSKVAPVTPPTAPSTDFFGESLGAILCLPKRTPVKYANVSLPHDDTNTSHTIYLPSPTTLTLYIYESITAT